MATPRDLGANPDLKPLDAEVTLIFLEIERDDLPSEPIEKIETIFFTPEGSLINDKLVLGSIFSIFAEDPGLEDMDMPLPGLVSK